MSPGAISTDSPTGDPARWQKKFELRCADAHGCRCGKVFSGSAPRELVALAREHGERVHCFTPAFYSPQRLAQMTKAAGGGPSNVP
jgi:hypothetical protein